MSERSLDRGGFRLASAVRGLYQTGQSDYAMPPLVLVDRNQNSIGRIQDGDSVIFCCRRGEREVELTEAFVEPEFCHFPRKDLSHLNFIILTLYHEKFKHLPVAFAPEKVSETLGQMVSQVGLRQLRVAESDAGALQPAAEAGAAGAAQAQSQQEDGQNDGKRVHGPAQQEA